MALISGSIFAVSATATTGNVNGAGFNPANAHFPTDGVIASGTTNSPTLTSATYTFVAGDVNAYVYFPPQSNIYSGWYQIASVAGGVATLSAAIGTMVTAISLLGVVTYNANAGCATTGAPTGVTYGVDYSQQDTANSSITDAASVGSSVTLTSVTAPWTPVSVGNFFHLATAGTGGFGVVGWYEIVTYNSAGSVTTDRTTNTGTALVAGTGKTGGAGRLNGLEQTFLTALPTGAIVFIKNGTYTISASITSTASGTGLLPICLVGYNAVRGDSCTGANRPVIAVTTNAVTMTNFIVRKNLIFTGTGTTLFTDGSESESNNCKFFNTSSSSGHTAYAANSSSYLVDCEVICQNGVAVLGSSQNPRVIGCYIHDSVTGISCTGTFVVINSIFASNITADITCSNSSNTNNCILHANTFYGTEAKIGIGLNLTGGTSFGTIATSNIFYGKTTGISATANGANFGFGNNFFNNTTDVSGWSKDPSSTALNPTFNAASQQTGTTANTSGSVLTDSGANFNVTNNVDFLHVVSGTGVTVGCYLITGNTSTTLTVSGTLGTDSSNDCVYFVTHGTNWTPASSFNNTGFPTFSSSGSNSENYSDAGAIQPQNSGSGGGGTFFFG